MSQLSQFHAAALARAQKRAGDVFVFAGTEFLGTRGTLKPDDPRLPGAGDRAFLLTVIGSALPAGGGSTGAELTCDGARYRVTRPGTAQPDGTVQLILVPLP